MKSRTKFLLTCMTGALVIGMGPMTSKSHAADTMPVKAMPAADPVPYWWFHGEVEVGGRFFLNDPQKDGIGSQGGKSLAKFYEYRDLRPGPFGNAHLSAGTSDGRYQVDVWGKNIGYDDQRFDLRASKAGEHYFNFQWDETPHFYGTGSTIYNGNGTNALTLPAGLSNTLFGLSGNTAPAGNQATIRSTINAFSHQVDLGIRRDTATVEYRWTPTDAWDIHFNYDHTHRTGTQIDGVVFSPGTSGVVSQVAKPVDDVTQNFGVNGEYAGTSPWGKKITFKAGYSGSVYQEANDSYTVENPFCPTGAVGTTCARTGQASSPIALMSLWPDNQANGFNTTLGADLPWMSRYVGTVSYNMMRQNQNFLPFTANTALAGVPGLPAASLNGNINTLLSNNVLTTQITPELKSKLSYRYYDYANNTPEILFPNWVLTDAELASAASAAYVNVHSISISYNKQNAGAELNWRPTNDWNIGVGYGYERYDWTRADADVTNEHSGKVYADWKPQSWLTARASWLSAERRYDNYNYLAYVGGFQWLNGGSTRYSSAMRQFYLDNRDRNKGQVSVAVDVIHGLTVTPTFGIQDDNYLLSSTEIGLQRNQAWRAGVELAYVVNPDTVLLFSYMNENYKQQLRASTSATVPPPAANTYDTPVRDTINTFMGSVKYAAIPNKLDLMLSYTVSLAKNTQPVQFENGALPSTGQYPDVKTTWQRVEATGKYKFDKETVEQLGWKGDVYAKVLYAWERNSVANWQDDLMQTYMVSSSVNYGYMTWLAYDNPNYNVHQLMASLIFKW